MSLGERREDRRGSRPLTPGWLGQQSRDADPGQTGEATGSHAARDHDPSQDPILGGSEVIRHETLAGPDHSGYEEWEEWYIV